MPAEEYSNPLAPPDHRDDRSTLQSSASSKHPLTNADFRKLLMTPRVGGGQKSSQSQGISSGSGLNTQRSTSGSQVDVRKGKSKPGTGGGSLPRKKKAHFKSKKEEQDELIEILKNYRDRARERRDGEGKDGVADIDLLQLTSGYRAVAHDGRSSLDAAERRKQMIQESKYLGGDMEHTHLVKGLDYALLQKVRSEILSKEQEEEELEKIYHSAKGEREEVEAHMKVTIAKNIYRALFKQDYPRVNEAFAPRRMAYVVELDEDYAESDIPTTLMRSKQECPVDEASTNLSTNDMVIQKLTQVLAYLRTDTKRKKKEKGGERVDDNQRTKLANQNIYDDSGEYVPNLSRTGIGKRASDKSYFEKPDEEQTLERKEKDNKRNKQREAERQKDRNRSSRYRENERDRGDRRQERSHRDREREGNREVRKENTTKQHIDARLAQGWAPADISLEKQQQMGRNPSSGLTKAEKDQGMGSVFKRDESVGTHKSGNKSRSMKLPLQQDDSYAECYPGYLSNFDVGGDSDDDTDFTKMDLGNKKGPVKRWDFETELEYEEYMSKREALPKAAFQYGLKMNDGRKTRKTVGAKSERNEKQKIDRQWNQISKIIAKRKSDGGREPERKLPKTDL